MSHTRPRYSGGKTLQRESGIFSLEYVVSSLTDYSFIGHSEPKVCLNAKINYVSNAGLGFHTLSVCVCPFTSVCVFM